MQRHGKLRGARTPALFLSSPQAGKTAFVASHVPRMYFGALQFSLRGKPPPVGPLTQNSYLIDRPL